MTLQAPRQATKGAPVTLNGKVKKTHHHKTRVTIQEKHGKTWKPLGHTTTSKKGKFHTREALKGKTTVVIRAKAKGHGTSAPQKVTLTQAVPPPPDTNNGGNGTGGGNVQPSGPQAQSITWDTNLGGDHTVGDSMDLKAHAQSGEPVTYTSSNTNAATISGNTLNFTGLGKASITATIPGDASWKPASTSQTLKVDVATVPQSNPTALQAAVQQAPSGSTLYLSGDYSLGYQIGVDNKNYKSGIVVEKKLTLNGGATLKPALDAPGDVVDVTPKGDLTLDGGITITGGHQNEGGGIYNNGVVDIKNAFITDNIADVVGGGIYNGEDATLTMEGGSITHNGYSDNKRPNTQLGGGIYNFGGTVTLIGGKITENRASNNGGGIFNSPGWTYQHMDHDGILTVGGNATITDNVAYNKGGGIYTGRGNGSAGGHAVVNLKGDAKITANHVNNGGDGGGVLVDKSASQLQVNGDPITQEAEAATIVFGNYKIVHTSQKPESNIVWVD